MGIQARKYCQQRLMEMTISPIPGPPVPGDHPVEERGDIAGKEVEEDLALHGASLARVADVPGGAAFPGNPATRTGLGGSEFRVFGIAVNSYATSRIGRLSNHNKEK